MLLMAALWLPLLAQVVEVTIGATRLDAVEEPAFYPVLNATGDRLLYLNESSRLKLYDFNDGMTTTVSPERVAGNEAWFGVDGMVYFVTQNEGGDSLLYRTGHRYDVATRETIVITEPYRGKALPSHGGTMKAAGQGYAALDGMGRVAWTEGNRVHVIVDGKERIFSPVDTWAGYLWASLSPDGKRVAFFAAGKGVVVIDLRGQLLAMLGNYEMPCWYNNDYIVAQDAKFNGHRFTSSQLLLLKADGTWRAELTLPGAIAMQPTCGGGKLICTTHEGLLHEIQITLHE